MLQNQPYLHCCIQYQAGSVPLHRNHMHIPTRLRFSEDMHMCMNILALPVGESEASTQHKADMMRRNGVQPILHSAAESDVSCASTFALSAEEVSSRASDHNLQSFLASIDLGRRAGGKPFIQAKVSSNTLWWN